MGGGGCRAIKFRAVNLAETSTLIYKYANLFVQVSNIGPSWSSCCLFQLAYSRILSIFSADSLLFTILASLPPSQ